MRRKADKWVKKCVSNFSLYTHLVSSKVTDPSEELAAIESGEFKQVSKSSKKRLRRQRKAQKLCDEALKQKAAQMKAVTMKKKTKKAMRKIINKLNELPL